MADHTTEPHTAEPWAGMMASNETVIYGDYHDGSGKTVAKLTGVSKPDFTRIIQCVCGCAGLNPKIVPDAVAVLHQCEDAITAEIEDAGLYDDGTHTLWPLLCAIRKVQDEIRQAKT